MLNTQNTVFVADQAAKANPVRTSKVLAVSFAHECGFRPLPWMERNFLHLLNEGFEYLLLVEIIGQTSRAPRPSWAYLDSIVRRCRMHEIYTLVNFFASMPRHDEDFDLKWAKAMRDIPEDIIDEAIKNFTE